MRGLFATIYTIGDYSRLIDYRKKGSRNCDGDGEFGCVWSISTQTPIETMIVLVLGGDLSTGKGPKTQNP